jgi:tRNA threonylcarbamoyladenosine biosynthesis protein TsaE
MKKRIQKINSDEISLQRQVYKNVDVVTLENIALIIASQVEKTSVVLLYGDLGTGKTTFAAHLIRALIGERNEQITSPTFNLVHVYDGPNCSIWHFDLYRLKKSQEIYELGITLIEWPEIVEQILPPDAIKIYFSFGDKDDLRNVEVVK